MVRKTRPPARLEGDTIDVVHHARSDEAHGSAVWVRATDRLRAAGSSLPTDTDDVSGAAPRSAVGRGGGAAPGPRARGVGHGRIGGPPGSTSGTPEERVRRVIATARAQTGRGFSYSWGAGGYGGASHGISSPSPDGHYDHDVLGFDSAGLTLYAFWKGAGIDIGAHPEAQYGHSCARRVPYGQRKPGDLLFWGGGPSSTTHVAIYVGDNEMIEASWPRDADSIRVSRVGGPHGPPMSTVVRFIE
ncbi:C40 family peptidase [Nocardiopsis lucentensis]|uniref:C40 family peptidase n=1 Tax=Nocardiopsis lucentensis TaxID=53441 RepID=UPI00037C665F|nr:NlpC/P60 family protein [Nocardiopsis lucentensis]